MYLRPAKKRKHNKSWPLKPLSPNDSDPWSRPQLPPKDRLLAGISRRPRFGCRTTATESVCPAAGDSAGTSPGTGAGMAGSDCSEAADSGGSPRVTGSQNKPVRVLSPYRPDLRTQCVGRHFSLSSRIKKGMYISCDSNPVSHAKSIGPGPGG